MSDSLVQSLLASNASFAAGWSAPPHMEQIRETAREPILVVTCMDPRVVPEQFLGSNHRLAVYRNAGGRAGPDVVRTIAVLQSLAYKAEKVHVLVVHHTDCGATHLSGDVIRRDLQVRGVSGDVEIDFGTFKAEDLEKSVVDDVAYLLENPLIRNVEIHGFVLDTDSGLLRAV